MCYARKASYQHAIVVQASLLEHLLQTGMFAERRLFRNQVNHITSKNPAPYLLIITYDAGLKSYLI